jgi:urease subunit beta
MIPGEYFLAAEDIVANAGRETAHLRVINTGDRPIQIGSHFHFFEANRALAFDRAAAFGMRLNIPSGAAVRFEPGDDKAVILVKFGGRAIARGFNNLTDGATTEADKPAALRRAQQLGFEGTEP